MLVLLVILFVSAVSIFFFVPIRKKVLIEGVLERIEKDKDFFRGIPFTEYQFKDYCLNCLTTLSEAERDARWGRCRAQIPGWAKKLNYFPYPFEPMPGDSIKIIVGKSLSGRIISYQIYPTNFAEMFKKQLQDSHILERSLRKIAREKGITIEEARRERDERVQEIITRKEERAKKLGITSEELFELEREAYAQATRFDNPAGCIGKRDLVGEISSSKGDLTEEDWKKIDEERERHLEACDSCRNEKNELVKRSKDILNNPENHRHQSKDDLRSCCVVGSKISVGLIESHITALSTIKI